MPSVITDVFPWIFDHSRPTPASSVVGPSVPGGMRVTVGLSVVGIFFSSDTYYVYTCLAVVDLGKISCCLFLTC